MTASTTNSWRELGQVAGPRGSTVLPRSFSTRPTMCEAFRQRHARWRAQHRIIFFCGLSSGFGGFLNSITAGFAASLLTERALIISCPKTHEAESITREVGHYFHGVPGVDWSPTGLPLKELYSQAVLVRVPASGYGPHGVLNQTHSHMSADAYFGDRALFLFANEHTALDKLLSINRIGSRRHMKALESTMDTTGYDFATIARCALQTLFVPSQELLAAAREVLGQSTDVQSGPPYGGLEQPYTALHVRLGDGSMAQPKLDGGNWKWAREERPVPIIDRAHPEVALRCFQRTFSPPHVVITDTLAVAKAAEELGMITTSRFGRAFHMGMRSSTCRLATASHSGGMMKHSNNKSVHEPGCESGTIKLFLDWLLLAMANESRIAGQSALSASARYWHARTTGTDYRHNSFTCGDS